MAPEPESTRMQVVNGFSELMHNFLQPALDGPTKPLSGSIDKPKRRRSFEAHWPKWRGEFWNCHFDLEDVGPVATIIVYPCGTVQLTLHATNGTGREVYFQEQRYTKVTPYELLAEKLPMSFLYEKLLEHLRQACKIED